MGSKNNLVSVKKSDFEVFQALAMDSESMGQNQQSKLIALFVVTVFFHFIPKADIEFFF